jgi:hypothetical protein
LLPFPDLIIDSPASWELSALADRHYSRRTPGARQFLDVGKKIAIRNHEGTLVFGWVWSQRPRWDGQTGFYCAIFRNESERKGSEVVLEAERIAVDNWGQNRMFTYIDPRKLRTIKRRGREFCRWPPGRCFLEAGWHFERIATSGKFLFVKNDLPARSPNASGSG